MKIAKYVKNQGFTSTDVLSISGLLALIIMLCVPIFFRAMQTEKINLALNQMRDLAFESGYGQQIQLSELREIASTSHSAQKSTQFDPWGNQYQIEFIRNSSHQVSHVLVWSNGPNRIMETTNPIVSTQDTPRILFQGDDFGYVAIIK